MRKFPILFYVAVLSLIAGCSKTYKSHYEASEACREWKSNGVEYKYKYMDECWDTRRLHCISKSKFEEVKATKRHQ